jgi:aspartyl-tRNA synthetase
VETKFASLYTAFQYGAPPHGGMGIGIDRILMLLSGEENLREVQVFPPNVGGIDNMMGSPAKVSEQQLREIHMKVRD